MSEKWTEINYDKCDMLVVWHIPLLYFNFNYFISLFQDSVYNANLLLDNMRIL
jgi:hypothetical protein